MSNAHNQAHAHDLANKFWDLGNLLTGFAVAQTLATLFELRAFLKGINGQQVKVILFLILISMLIFNGLYWYAVYQCHQAESKLRANDPPLVHDLSKLARTGRVGAIILFTLVGIVAVVIKLAEVT